MKISITNESKQYLTVNEYAAAKQLIKGFADESIVDFAMTAANIATDGRACKVLEATATVCRNNRVWNQYNDDSGMLDVWVDATVKTRDGFVVIGATVTDIWSSTGDNYKEITPHMYVELYTKTN